MMITSPGMGIYQRENWGARRRDINHEPQIGYAGGNGKWCKVCKKLFGEYSWVDAGKSCDICRKRKNKKLNLPI